MEMLEMQGNISLSIEEYFRALQLGQKQNGVRSVWRKLLKSKQSALELPKSYQRVADAMDDPVTTAKIAFFSYVASLMEPYLKMYQSDEPMILFMYVDLNWLLENVVQIIVNEKE